MRDEYILWTWAPRIEPSGFKISSIGPSQSLKNKKG